MMEAMMVVAVTVVGTKVEFREPEEHTGGGEREGRELRRKAGAYKRAERARR